MNITALVRFGTGSVACLLLGTGTVVGAAEYDQNIAKEFQGAAGGKLIVQSDRGSIEVNSGAGDKIHVRVFRRVKGGSRDQADELFANHEVTFRQDGNTLSVVGRSRKDRLRPGRIRQPGMQVRFEITLPRKFDVDLRTSGGDIRLGELDGSAVTRTSSGAIKVRRASGKIEASNSGGDIRVDEANQAVVASTSSGSITLKTVQGGVEAKNSGGDIKIETASGDVSAQTSSGSIRIGHASGKRVSAKNSGGDVSLGEVEGDVVAQTSSGSIKIGIVNGKAELKNSGGQINIGEAGSSLLAETSSASIEITTVKGQVEVRNSGGKIEVNDALDVVLAHTSSGPIIVGFGAQPKADSLLEVSGGDIKVTLPRSAAVDVDARSSGGKVISAFPVTSTVSGELKHGALRGKINGGGSMLSLRASSGDIRLTESAAQTQ